ncbi:hypothetical protein KHP57_09060 [Algiphilus sp. NNCM1]|nr:hypothetical protein [Algiphilus acroporae]
MRIVRIGFYYEGMLYSSDRPTARPGMYFIVVGLLLAGFGLVCHWRGVRALPFASERAEYLPANLLVQAAALAWLLPAIAPLQALAILALQMGSLAALAGGAGVSVPLSHWWRVLRRGPHVSPARAASAPRWEGARGIRSGS